MAGYARSGGGADLSAVTAGGPQVLSGYDIIDSSGQVTAGEMPDLGAVLLHLDAENGSAAIPYGCHNGQGAASVELEETTVSASGSADVEVAPTTGKLLSKVTVRQIAVPGDAAAADVISGKTFLSSGSLLPKTGSMPDRSGQTNYEAAADLASSYLRLRVPGDGKYTTANYLRASYATIAGLIGLDAAYFLSGKTILGVSGAIPTYSSAVAVSSADVYEAGSYFYMEIPAAAYYTNNAYLRIARTSVASVVGLTSSILKNGESVLGINGSYGGSTDVLYRNGTVTASGGKLIIYPGVRPLMVGFTATAFGPPLAGAASKVIGGMVYRNSTQGRGNTLNTGSGGSVSQAAGNIFSVWWGENRVEISLVNSSYVFDSGSYTYYCVGTALT